MGERFLADVGLHGDQGARGSLNMWSSGRPFTDAETSGEKEDLNEMQSTPFALYNWNLLLYYFI